MQALIRNADHRVMMIGDNLGEVPDFTLYSLPDELDEIITSAMSQVGLAFQGFTLTPDGKVELVPVDPPAANPIRGAIVNTVQSAIGVQIANLTVLQQRALLACVLYKMGALDQNLGILPLAQWL